MAFCSCMLQEGQIPAPVVAKLGEGLKKIVVKGGLGDDLDISWIFVKEGQGWTAGEASTSSIVTLMAPPIEQEHRVEMLSAICNMWAETSGCHVNEVVATLMPVE